LAGYALAPAFTFYALSNPSLFTKQIQSGTAPLVAPAALLDTHQKITSTKLPTRLKIPAINVDAALEYVGLTSEKAVDTPKGPTNAAWFNASPRPGDTGNSVIVGHFGWKNGIPAVFDNLHKLQKGDTLSVQGEKGTTIIFIVRESRTYGPDEDATDVFRSRDNKAHLNLITCQGAWNSDQKSYSKRLVVFADKTE
jgi:sortase A